jgi:general stress protein 26
LPSGRGNEARHPGYPDPRDDIPIKKVRDIYLSDLHVDTLIQRPGTFDNIVSGTGVLWTGKSVRSCYVLFAMSKKDNIDRVWDIIEKAGVCMLTTQFGGGLRARPLEARPDRDAGLIFFVTDIHSAKEDEIKAAPNVGLVFIDSNDKAYLSITGRARVMRDAEKMEAAWRKTDEMWWPGGPNDPDVCLLRIEPFTAELWDGPSSAAVAAFEFAKARLTGEEPKLGENLKVTVKM